MAEVLLGTGVLLLIGEEFPVWPFETDESRAELEAEMTPQERAHKAADERGEIVFVSWHVFADLEDEGRRFRVGGSFGGHSAIRLDEDPTTALLGVVENALDSGNLENLLDDLKLGDMNVTDFEFFAVPSKIEMSSKLHRALRGTWREREPTGRFVLRSTDPNWPVTTRHLPGQSS